MTSYTSDKRKYYVVWEGHAPGIYDSWDECRQQIEGFPGAKYRSYPNLADATEAFRGDPKEQLAMMRSIMRHRQTILPPEIPGTKLRDYSVVPEIRLDAIAVDGACAKNPGPMEYRAVEVATGREIFHVGPLQGGTNNIAEYLAIIHAAALLHKQGNYTTPIYSDSRTAQSWVRKRHSNTKIEPTAANAQVLALLERANAWMAANDIVNPLLKWDTDSWGEIPADFGRK